MTDNEYELKKEEVLNDAILKGVIWGDEFISGKFNLMSASLYNFLPKIAYERHEDIFRNISINQKLSLLEQGYLNIQNRVVYENFSPELLNTLKNKSGIICTFHLGSYRLINQFLLLNKMPFTIVASKAVVESQTEEFINIRDKVDAQDYDLIKIIDAESEHAIIKILRDIKAGRILVFYIDGNMGTGENSPNNPNLINVSFLGQRLLVRKGIAYISHTAKVPIYTVACFREKLDDIRIRFFEPIYPKPFSSRNEYAEFATQKIYHYIEPIIKKHPEQWEAWLYIHKAINFSDEPDSEEIISDLSIPDESSLFALNLREFGVFKLLECTYLFRKKRFKSYLIDLNLFNFLKKSITKPIKRNEINEVVFSQLYQNRVLITAQ